jgi:hypothetical protein
VFLVYDRTSIEYRYRQCEDLLNRAVNITKVLENRPDTDFESKDLF